MEADETDSAVVTGRTNRLVTTCCLAVLVTLIIVLGLVVSSLWYSAWDNGNINSERRETALASILERAHDAADDTAHALDTTAATDADALTEVIWQRTEAPMIAYDASRREFTATTARSALYDEKVVLLRGGPVKVTRCLVFTYTHRPGQAWTPQVTERDDEVCHPGTEISILVHLTRTRISSMHAEDLTQTGVRKALDPTGKLRSYDVKSVVRRGDSVAVSILVSSPGTTVGQCYRFIRPVHGDDSQISAAAVPASSC
ncbi:hypothetical protein ABZ678_29020 [Streptomyces hirsutus]|uniref:hypothetical protein n=1 Tax=Streptomyces hirsutus TaxID=35620 RepID=UPI0034038F68